MATITVSVRTSVGDPDNVADVVAALKDKAYGALNQQGLNGSIFTQVVSTDEDGEKVVKTKLDFANYATYLSEGPQFGPQDPLTY